MSFVVNGLNRFDKAPLVVRGSLAMSALYTLLAAAILLAPNQCRWLLHYVGANVVPLAFGTFAFLLMAVFANQRLVIRRLPFLLLALAALGAFDVYRHHWGVPKSLDRLDDSYLNYTDWQPLFTVIVPTIWAAVLSTRSVRDWALLNPRVAGTSV